MAVLFPFPTIFFFNFGGDAAVSPFAVPMVFRASVQYTVGAQYLLLYTHFNTWKYYRT